MKTIKEQIVEIEKTRYNNYRGRFFKELWSIHRRIRNHMGDEAFLDYLQTLEKENPKPVFNL